MATATITPDQDAVLAEIHIDAPPERVFQAITDPRQMLQWWGQKGLYRCSSFHTDVRPGGNWRSEGVNENGQSFHVGGEYLEVDPPRLLVYTWIAGWTGDLETTVRWELSESDGGTLVTIRHAGFAARPGAVKEHALGWQRVLGWMQAFVEEGATVNSRPPVAAA